MGSLIRCEKGGAIYGAEAVPWQGGKRTLSSSLRDRLFPVTGTVRRADEKAAGQTPAAVVISCPALRQTASLLLLYGVFAGRLVELVLANGGVKNDALPFDFRVKDEPAIFAANRAFFIDRGCVGREQAGAERDSSSGKDKKEVFHGMDNDEFVG
jgi:hypothetical protein